VRETIGIIIRVTGKVEISSDGKQSQTLTPETGSFVVVHKFDRLMVKSGEVSISMADGTKLSIKASRTPYVLRGKGLPTLAEQFRRDGLSRGASDGRIVCPMPSERVTLDTLTVRWNLQPNIKSFTLVRFGKSEGIAVTADSVDQVGVTEADLSALRTYIQSNGIGRYQLSSKAVDSSQSFEIEIVADVILKRLSSKLAKFSDKATDGLVMRAHICASERFLGMAQDYMKLASDLSPKNKQVSKLFLEISKLGGDIRLVELAESRMK
jgi:hypothetical protein